MVQTPACKRQYILLQGPNGATAGLARLDLLGGRARMTIRASHLPEEPVRALLLARDGAVADLGLMHQGTLCWNGMRLGTGYHTLALATDWPQARLVLYGFLRPCQGRTLGTLQAAISHYLRYPAENSAPAPLALPETRPKRGVFMLRPLTTDGKRLQ